MGVPYSIGPLVVVALTGTAGLSGLAISLLGISRFMVAYPLGRRAVMFPGGVVASVGALLGCVCKSYLGSQRIVAAITQRVR